MLLVDQSLRRSKRSYAGAVEAFFVLLFSSADYDHMGLDFVVAAGGSTAVAPLSVDFAMLIEMELWLGHLISSLFPNSRFLAKSSDSVENFCRKFSVRQLTPCFHCHYEKMAERVGFFLPHITVVYHR